MLRPGLGTLHCWATGVQTRRNLDELLHTNSSDSVLALTRKLNKHQSSVIKARHCDGETRQNTTYNGSSRAVAMWYLLCSSQRGGIVAASSKLQPIVSSQLQ
ncbi:hypothetical protein N658DRAFT_140264 [Parathielavia hyrcaniae]|uniref:Uncharacterized protein n=1 Tax=Parathielavia hyrcaniae TaxID=113614 RepID=A0AAN6Q366_9PEZI|nr:hypothetical protein N658DRAFT_140264 [Parathielavia hyrcaniae]